METPEKTPKTPFILDCHTHSEHSSDGHHSIEAMIRLADEKGLDYLAITDHCDFDAFDKSAHAPVGWRLLDVAAYVRDFNETAARLNPTCKCAFGVEVGYSAESAAATAAMLKANRFDKVINSVHFCGGWDMYYPEYFAQKTKRQAYDDYLDEVYESLNAPYDYDTVGHIGYVTRKAPYADNSMPLSEFGEKLERIFRRIIELGKIVEVNMHVGMLPTEEMLRLYYALGGRRISYGSDAHHLDLCKDFEAARSLVKRIGFAEWTYTYGGKYLTAPID